MGEKDQHAVQRWIDATIKTGILKLKQNRKWKDFKEIGAFSQGQHKFTNLEKEIEEVNIEIEDAKRKEKRAQDLLSETVLRHSSITQTFHNARQTVETLQLQCETKRIEMNKFKKLELNSQDTKKRQLRKKAMQMEEEIESHELEIQTTCTMLSFLDILNIGSNDKRFYNVKHYWYDVVMKITQLQSRVGMDQGYLIPKERQDKEKQRKDEVQSLKSDLERKVSTIESIFPQVALESVRLYHSDNEEYKDDKPADRSKEIIYKRENENIIDKGTIEKNKSGVEEDLKDGQNQQMNYKSDDERYGLIIESIYQKDVSYKAEPLKAEERMSIITGNVFPDGFKLETDIFYIKKNTAGTTHHTNKESVKAVLIKVPFSKENSPYYEYKGAVKFGQKWKIIDYILQDEYMVFEVDQVESFCVISMEYRDKHIVLPLGSQFISERDNRIKVIFPPDAVSTKKEITFKIHPVNLKCVLERTSNECSNMCMITPGLSTNHVEFKKMFKVQLPIHLISNSNQNTDDYKYEIFKWNDTGSFELTDLHPTVSNGIACFETNSFCGYGCVATPKSQITSSIEDILREAYGFKKWCKILFFVGKKGNRNLPIMLECVDLHRVKDVVKKRAEYEYYVVSEWIGKDFLFIPDKTIITVDVKGSFGIPKESSVKHPKLSFIPVARENFTRFLVEIKTSGSLYGVLSIRDSKGVLDEILYNPASTKNLPPNMTIRDKLVGNRNNQLTSLRPLSAGKPQRKGSAKKAASDQKDDFFTEKGLLALSKLLSPDTMHDVCINMDMTTSTCETIREKHKISTLGNIALWKTALDQQPHNKQLENLIKALIAAGQKALADKVQLLHSTGKDLHTISSSESV